MKQSFLYQFRDKYIILIMIVNILKFALKDSLHQINRLPYSAFFKKKLSQTNVQAREQNISARNNNNHAIQFQPYPYKIQQLLSSYEMYFHQQRHKLPKYLCKLSKIIDSKTFQQNKEVIEAIHYKLNKCSSELLLQPNELIEILIFHQKIKAFSKIKQQSNNGFEYRADMLAATFLYKKQFTFTQSVAIFLILQSIGSSSLLFVSNFTQYLKQALQDPNSASIVKIQHLIAILSIYLNKVNHTVLENILYDITLNYVLSNAKLMTTLTLTLKVELVKIMLCIDINQFYLSQASKRDTFVRLIILSILPEIGEKWMHQVTKNGQFNLLHALTIIESYSYICSRQIISSKMAATFSRIVDALWIQIRQLKAGLGVGVGVGLLIRFLFNEQIFLRHNLSKKVLELLLDVVEKSNDLLESDLNPILNHIEKDEFISFLPIFHQLLIRKKILFSPMIKLAINSKQTAQIQKIITYLSDILSKNQNQNLQSKLKSRRHSHLILVSFILLRYIQHQKLTNFSQQIVRFEIDIKRQVESLKKNKITYISQLTETIDYLRILPQLTISFCSIIAEIDLISELNTTHQNKQNKYERDQYLINITKLIFYLLCKDVKSLTAKLYFNQTVLMTYLSNLSPLNYPKPQGYFQPMNIFGKADTFQSNFKIIAKNIQNQKYYFALWNVFINNYSVHNRDVRKESFPLLVDIFKQCYKRQTSRKIVLLSTLTNYMATGVIIASRTQLQSFFQQLLDELINQNGQKFHYHCYLRITYNAHSCGILTPSSFTKIVKCQKQSESSRTSILMLFYGFMMRRITKKETIPNHYLYELKEQQKYLKIILLNKSVKIINQDQYEISTSNQFKKHVLAGSKFISILLEYGQEDILPLAMQIIDFIKNCEDFGQIRQMAHSFRPQSYNLKQKQMKDFVCSISTLFLQKFEYFWKVGYINHDQYEKWKQQLKKQIKSQV